LQYLPTAYLKNTGDMAEGAVELTAQLIEAAGKGQVDAVRALVGLGADVHVRLQDGCTALHLAADKGHGEVVKVLVDLGADVHAQVQDGHTPLHQAALNGHGEVVTVLVGLGVDVHAQTQDGGTALHEAAAGGHGEVAKTLVELGADVQSRDAEGRTPAFYANNPQVRALLQRRPAASQPRRSGPRCAPKAAPTRGSAIGTRPALASLSRPRRAAAHLP